MVSAGLSGGLGWSLDSWSSSCSEGSCAAASAAAAGGTRATPLPELAEPSFPPKRPSGQHLNIGKIFGASPESTDLQEKFIQKVTFSPQKNVILSTKFSIYILLHAGYTQNLYKCSVHIYLRHCVNKLLNLKK